MLNNDVMVRDAFKRFIFEKQVTNRAPMTIENYQQIFQYFMNFIGEKSLCRNITRDTLLEYLQHLRNNTKATPRSQITYMVHIRTVINYFIKHGYTPKLNGDYPMPIADKTYKIPYSEEDIIKFTVKPDIKKCTIEQFRDWVMVCCVLETGIRVRNIVNLKIEDIDLDAMQITLEMVKTRKPYRLPLSTSLGCIFSEYLILRNGKPNDYVFAKKNGDKLNESGAISAMKRYCTARGIKRQSLHLLRHTFADNFCDLSDPISGELALMHILGHSTLTMSKEYKNRFRMKSEDFDKYSLLKKCNVQITKH